MTELTWKIVTKNEHLQLSFSQLIPAPSRRQWPAENSNNMNDKSSTSNTVMPSTAKYIVPAKRKPGGLGKLSFRMIPLIANNGGPQSQQE